MGSNLNSFFSNEEIQKAINLLNKSSKFNQQNKNIDEISDSIKKFNPEQSSRSFFIGQTDNTKAIASIASSLLYKNLNINTPPVYFLKKTKKSISTIQQSVNSFDDIITVLANDDLEYSKLKKQCFGKYKWQIFYDNNLINSLLNFMTPECLDQLQNIFLVDELRTDIDRHLKNYFFYKHKNTKKYEGIIVIDLEQMIIYNYCNSKKDDFLNFLFYPYQSETPQQVTDELCYAQRVKNIRELINDGVLSSSNIEVLIKSLKYDFPSTFKTLTSNAKLNRKDKNNIISPVERLWEYNNDTIGKDLGL